MLFAQPQKLGIILNHIENKLRPNLRSHPGNDPLIIAKR